MIVLRLRDYGLSTLDRRKVAPALVGLDDLVAEGLQNEMDREDENKNQRDPVLNAAGGDGTLC